MFFILKPNRELQPCVDYQQLNSIIIKDRYLLLLITEIQDIVYRKKWFIRLNIIEGYANI